jgi:HK97 family phage portal protein
MFLETNKQAIHEIANWLGLPPHKLGALENSNNSNMVQQNVAYVSDSIIPWKSIVQQEYNTKLFSPKEKAQGIQTHFDDEILLQSDKLAQSRFFRNLVYAGIITSDQAAQKLGFPSLPGGDQRMTPVNMQTQEQIDKKLQENADKTISK